MIEWTLKELAIKDIKSHPKNPREIGKHQFEHLDNLIAKFGMIDKPIVNADMVLIGGHQRIRVLKRKKQKKVECWVANTLLSDDQVDELCIGLNLFQGKFDFDILGNMWEPLDLLKYGFTEEQLLGTCKEAQEVLEGTEDKKSKKTKECPNCGHSF